MSAAFAFDTRAFDGLGDDGVSGNFVLDTRTNTASGLVVVGPSAVSASSQTEYRIVMNQPGGGTTDVTNGAFLSFTGSAPTFAGIGGTTLFAFANAPTGTLHLQARYQNAAGQVVSPAFPVSIGPVFSAAIMASEQPLGGSSHQVTLSGTASGGTPGYVYRWDTDDDGAFDDLIGNPVNYVLSSQGGSYRLRLEVTDAAGAKRTAQKVLTIDKAATPGEPPKYAPAYAGLTGRLYGLDGQPFLFDEGRAATGLIVIVHGLFSSGVASPPETTWLQDLAEEIEGELADENKPLPNIAIYDWPETLGLAGTIPLFDRDIFLALLVTEGLAQLGLTQALLGHLLTGVVLDTLADEALPVRVPARTHGERLAVLLRNQAAANQGLSANAPVHLVGHSAGGFVAAECAYQLKKARAKGLTNLQVDRVTMLDTPFPYTHHLASYPSPGYLDQLVSSVYGALALTAARAVQPGAYYYFNIVNPQFPQWTPTAHRQSHEWYEDHVAGPDDGSFYFSPFLHGPKVPRGAGAPAPQLISPYGALVAADPLYLGGFSTFGSVSANGTDYTITEQADAGIFKSVTVPPGVEALRFRYRFSTLGDGDFLGVRLGARPEFYIGLDHELSRLASMDVEVPIPEYAGQTSELVLTLVSRGTAQAVVEVGQIEFVVGADADRDGLDNDTEVALGTDPQRADSDGDGLSDATEYQTHGTNPLLADSDGDGQRDAAELAAGTDPLSNLSVFAVREILGGAGFTVRWSGIAGKTYRVQRSPTADFASFDVISSGIAGIAPLTSYTDTAVPSGTGAMFYRVVVE